MTKTSTRSFQWITNQAVNPYVTIDSQQRLYISKPARDLMVLPDGHFRLIAGYDFANHRIVLAKPEVVRVPNVVPYNFDKKAYSKVKHFVEAARLGDSLPIRFIYRGKDYSEYPQGAFAFEMAGATPEDG